MAGMNKTVNEVAPIYKDLFFTGTSPEALACQELLASFRELQHSYEQKANKEFDRDQAYAYTKISAGIVKAINKIENKAKLKNSQQLHSPEGVPLKHACWHSPQGM